MGSRGNCWFRRMRPHGWFNADDKWLWRDVSWLLWILFIAAVVYLVITLGKRGGRQDRQSSLEILKQRYARGELSKEEFENMKRDIEGR